MSALRTGLAIIVFAAAVPGLAQVQPKPQTQAPTSDKPFRPDQVICERQEDTGSRLTGRKVCRTRSQWAQIRQDERSSVERIQQQRTMDQNGN